MGLKISKSEIPAAVKKLALPDFILEEVKKQKKAFDKAVSSHNSFFSRFAEDERAKDERLKKLSNELKNPVQTIFNLFYATEGASGEKRKKLEKIAQKTREKLSQLQKKGYYEFNENDYKQQDSKNTVSLEDVKKCNESLNQINDVIKKYGSASISKIKFKKSKSLAEELKTNIKNPIWYIYAANQYYGGTVGYGALEKIADIVKKTLKGLKIEESKIDDNDLRDKIVYLNSESDLTNAVDKIPAIDFGNDKKFLYYKDEYKKFLNEVIDLYEKKHTLISVQKKKVRADESGNSIFYKKAREAHKFLKEIQDFEKFEGELKQLISENPTSQKSLKKSLEKIHNSKLSSSISSYTSTYEKLVYTAKFGEDLGYKFINLINRLNTYAGHIQVLISVFSNPKSSMVDCISAIEEVNEGIKDIKGIGQLVISEGRYNLTPGDAIAIMDKLSNLSRTLTEETRKWSKKYDEFQDKLAQYKKEHSTTQKVLKVIKMLGLIAALAAGAAQISATINSEGVDVKAYAKTKT